MLMNLHKKSWDKGLALHDYKEHETRNEKVVAEMLALAKLYNKVVDCNCILLVDAPFSCGCNLYC